MNFIQHQQAGAGWKPLPHDFFTVGGVIPIHVATAAGEAILLEQASGKRRFPHLPGPGQENHFARQVPGDAGFDIAHRDIRHIYP